MRRMLIFLIIFLIGLFFDFFQVNLLGITSLKLIIAVFIIKSLAKNFPIFLSRQKIKR